jgi:hypothetical protein
MLAKLINGTRETGQQKKRGTTKKNKRSFNNKQTQIEKKRREQR